MYKTEEFESGLCDSKAECLKQLAEHLNDMGGGEDIAICDIEKDWITARYVADYKPSLKLRAIILIYEFPEETGNV